MRSGSGIIPRWVTDERGQRGGDRGVANGPQMHRSGMSAPPPFEDLAEVTPEAHCARTYKLLASSEEMGVDLASGLRALAE